MVDGEEDIICAPLPHGTETIPYNSEKDIAGAQTKLREQVAKKHAKGDSVEKIADDLMEEMHVIEKIIKEL